MQRSYLLAFTAFVKPTDLLRLGQLAAFIIERFEGVSLETIDEQRIFKGLKWAGFPVEEELRKLRESVARKEIKPRSSTSSQVPQDTEFTIHHLENTKSDIMPSHEYPDRWLREAPKAMARDSRFVIKSWVRCLVTPQFDIAIGLYDLFQDYIREFTHFSQEHPLLNYQVFGDLVLETFEGIRVDRNEGRDVVVGLRWLTPEDFPTESGLPGWINTPRGTTSVGQLQSKRYIWGRPDQVPVQLVAGRNERNDSVQMPGAWPQQGTTQQTNSNVEEDDYRKVDPDGACRAWLQEHLISDPDCLTEAIGIFTGLHIKFPGSYVNGFWYPHLDLNRLTHLITEVFPDVVVLDEGHNVCRIDGVRWKKLEKECKLSLALNYNSSPEALRTEAHKLLHLPHPDRITVWLKMYFRTDESASFVADSLWKLYQHCFERMQRTHPLLDEDDFMECVKKSFKGVEQVEVSHRHVVFKGLSRRHPPFGAEQILRQKRKKDFRKLVNKGLVDDIPPHNKFTEALGKDKDPLLIIPRTTDGEQTISPLNHRLNRRRQEPEREPLGDEEPGFPGVSLKLEQSRMKSKWGTIRQLYSDSYADPEVTQQPTVEDWRKAAEELFKTMPLPPVREKLR